MDTQLHEYMATKTYKHRLQEANRNAERRLITGDYDRKSGLPVSTVALVSLIILFAIIAFTVL